MRWRADRTTAAIDGVIERSVRGEASAKDAEVLAAWRGASPANEEHYRRTIRLLVEMRSTGKPQPRVPSVDTILNRPRAPRSPKPRRRSLVPAVAAVAVAAVAAVTVAIRQFGPRSVDASVAGEGVGYSTGPVEMATIQLSDGSVVRLAPNSTLRFLQTRDAREATLDGRAFFSVAHIPGRSFRVRTRHGDANVLGTRFELSTGPDELTLLVVSGRVGLSAASNVVEVRGGQRSGVRDGTALEPQAVPKAETMEEWVGKFLAFQDTPIREVAREISEMYGLRVIVADSIVAGRTVSGTFTDRDARHVLESVCLAVDANCESRPGEVVMTSR